MVTSPTIWKKKRPMSFLARNWRMVILYLALSVVVTISFFMSILITQLQKLERTILDDFYVVTNSTTNTRQGVYSNSKRNEVNLLKSQMRTEKVTVHFMSAENGKGLKNEQGHEILTLNIYANSNDTENGGSLEYKVSNSAIPFLRSKEINCAALFNGDNQELSRAREKIRLRPKVPMTEMDYLSASRNCSEFVHKRGYIMSSMTKEEENFPIAYSILAYRNMEQVERLLRAIYRPQNFYCIHIDPKASAMKESFDSISRCFNNVKMAKSITVNWGGFNLLQAEMDCMEILLKMSAKWKYYINLTGEEFPLKTNAQLVKMLSFFNGANLMEGTRKR